MDERICPTCVEQLESLVTFLEQCIKAQEALQQHLWIPEVSIKDESEIKVERSDHVDGGSLEEALGLSHVLLHGTAVLDDSCSDDKEDADDLPLSMVRNELRTRKVLKKSRRIQCTQCDKVFRHAALLLKHMVKHSEPVHVCLACNEKFSSMRKLKMHSKSAHGETESEVVCDSCDERFTSQEYERHKQTRSPLTEPDEDLGSRDDESFNHTCPLCNKSFRNSRTLRDHHASVHIGFKKFVCHCGHSFHRRERLQYHIDYVHNKKEDRNYQCEECPKKFRNMEALRVHRKIHLDVKPYSCEVCQKEFRLKSQMQSHFTRIHSLDKSSLRTHLCDNCGKSFDCKANLLSHILRQHTENPERNVECPICKRKYLDKKSARRHMRMHNETKPFLCTQCARWFKSAPILQDHINRIHLELRPFECGTCGSKFKMNKDLSKHMRTHTGERPFPCPYCSYTCAVKSNLQKHISNIHMKNK